MSPANRHLAELAIARVMEDRSAGDDAWAGVADALEELARAFAGVTGAFHTRVTWAHREAAQPLGAWVTWAPVHRPGTQAAEPPVDVTDRSGWAEHAAGAEADPAAADGAPHVVIEFEWSCRDPDGRPVVSEWPDITLPSAVPRVMRSLTTAHPRHGHGTGELKPVIVVDAAGEGQSGGAHVEVAGNRIGPAHGIHFTADLPAGATLRINAALSSAGPVSMLSLMGEVLKAATGR